MLDNLRIMVDLHDGWENVVSFHSFHSLASVKDFSTLSFDVLDTFLVVVDTHLVVKWAHKSIWIKWVSHSILEFWVSFHHSINEAVIDRFVNEKSSKRSASLSSSSHSSKDRGCERHFLITVRHNDLGVVSTKLKNSLSESSVDFCRNVSTNCSRASEGNQWNSLVLN
jgi:hypothetical protein